jgi:hypothetical protein
LYCNSSATITRDECLHLNDILGVKTLSACHNVKHAIKADDSFTTQNSIANEDETRHRNSWLMPRMARRMTKNSPHHVTNWRQNVTVDDADCSRLRALLTEKMGSPADAEEHLPAACKH